MRIVAVFYRRRWSILAVTLALTVVVIEAYNHPGWQVVAPLNEPDSKCNDCVVLDDGRVLLVKRTGCELYDPVENRWSKIDSPHNPSTNALCLLQNGCVLLAGGDDVATPTCEIFDPKSLKWTPTTDLHEPRMGDQALRLPNGEVLIFGGAGVGSLDALTGEIYNPAQQTWRMAVGLPRYHLLTGHFDSKGRLIMCGGFDSDALDLRWGIYDPMASTWTPLPYPSDLSMQAILPDGRFLCSVSLTHQTKIFDGTTASEVQGYDVLSWAEKENIQSPLRLKDGRLLIIGGVWSGTTPDRPLSMQFYDWVADSSYPTSAPWLERSIAALVLPEHYPERNTCFTFDATLNKYSTATPMRLARDEAFLIQLKDGRIMVIGGMVDQLPSSECEMIRPEDL